jgi:integrase
VAGIRLQWLIIAAIETGCRAGELLALQWGDVSMDRRTVLIRAVEREKNRPKPVASDVWAAGRRA